jgi:hypothetical protein
VTDSNPRTIQYSSMGAGDFFGYSAVGVGDVNKDTFDDFIICGIKFNVGSFSEAGTCYLIYGATNLQSMNIKNLGTGGMKISGSATKQNLGTAVAAAGDINQDGYADFLIGCGDRKNVYLFYGGSSLPIAMDTSTAAGGSFYGVVFPNPTSIGDVFGASLSRAGDFNGDGIDDLLIGSWSQTASNCQVYVVFGGSSLTTTVDLKSLTSTTGVRYLTDTNDQGGSSVSGGVDLNEDGFDDIAIGAPAANSGHGAVHVVFGSASPVGSSVSQLGNGGISLTASSGMHLGSRLSMEENVRGTNSRGILSTSVTGGKTEVFIFHDVFSGGTSAPSAAPTTAPTVLPSAEPTFSHSTSPSVSPTADPSIAPSVSPIVTPTAVPSFRPSAPTYSPSAVPTPVATGRSKSSIVVNTGFTVNSVNGATLTPTSQETIKQSIANVSQTTVNIVDLVSVTRTNRRLLLLSSSSSSSPSSVVHWMLASVSLFSYKVVAEIHFNLIDFPGLNESYVAGTKSKVLVQSMESHEFDGIVSYYATINNATQLMSNATVSDVITTTSIIPAPDDSSSGSKEDLTVGEIIGIVVGAVAGACLLTVLIYLAVVQRRSQSEARRSIPTMELDYTPVAISERVVRSDNAVVDITKVYEDSSDKQFDHFKKQQMTASYETVVKL